MTFTHLYFAILVACAAGGSSAAHHGRQFKQPPVGGSTATKHNVPFKQPPAPDTSSGDDSLFSTPEKFQRADLFQIPADIPPEVKKLLENVTSVPGDESVVFRNESVVFSIGNAYRRQRSGSYSNGDMCHQVTRVPSHLTFITRYRHYGKYTHAYNIPIVSTTAVSDVALKRACYVLRFLLADRSVLRKYLYKNFGRIGIMGRREGTTSIPEHRHLGTWWDARARGLGGTLAIPISTGAEENLMCWQGDRYPREDIFLHEFSHGIQEVAIRGGGIPGYFGRLQRAYNSARYYGRWRSTYAMSTVQEYFAEGTQSYFHVNNYSPTPNGIHGPINTRAKLMKYDITLYNLVREVFPCGNRIWKRCNAKSTSMPTFYMDCDRGGKKKAIVLDRRGRFVVSGGKGGGGKKVLTAAPVTIRPPLPTQPTKGCSDTNENCKSWADTGYCSSYADYMNENCKKSCNKCGTKKKSCKDKNQYCSSWSRSGYCRNASFRDFMSRDCKKSCNKC